MPNYLTLSFPGRCAESYVITRAESATSAFGSFMDINPAQPVHTIIQRLQTLTTTSHFNSSDSVQYQFRVEQQPGCDHILSKCQIRCSVCDSWFVCSRCHIGDHEFTFGGLRCFSCQVVSDSEICQCGVLKFNYQCKECNIFAINSPFHYIEHVGDTCTAQNLLLKRQTDSCLICLSDVTPEEFPMLPLLCGHSFHAGCLGSWTKANATCPMDRSPIKMVDDPLSVYLCEKDVIIGQKMVKTGLLSQKLKHMVIDEPLLKCQITDDAQRLVSNEILGFVQETGEEFTLQRLDDSAAAKIACMLQYPSYKAVTFSQLRALIWLHNRGWDAVEGDQLVWEVAFGAMQKE